MKDLIKKLLGKRMLAIYHKSLAILANLVYGRPSEKLIVIGVTGTNGKSTTVNLIAKILEHAGNKVALSSTVNFKIADKEWLNDLKMTMPGRFFLQKFLRQALRAGCQFAVLEVSSEGIAQSRQLGIHFDCLVFTNLTPEHLESHGGFENYKNAKLKLFQQLQDSPHKFLAGRKINKTIVANADDRYFAEFTNFQVDRCLSFGRNGKVKGTDLQLAEQGISFNIGEISFGLKLKGAFDFENSLAAIAVAQSFGIGLKICQPALEAVEGIPGRMELIDEGQKFKILVDYAPEPASLSKLYQTVQKWPHGKIIHVLGSTGGGRDRGRRKVLGELAAQHAALVIVTNEDPYDDDPVEIINDVASGAPSAIKILDRREAIAKALSLAKVGDLVIITGKGAEQKMAVRGGYVPWDDRAVIREELKKL